MKLTSSMVAVVLLLATAGAFAVDKVDGKAPSAKPATLDGSKKATAKSAAQAEQVALTGSYIKREIHRNGLVTDGASAVVVLDSDAIRNSGAADIRELLLRRGLNH